MLALDLYSPYRSAHQKFRVFNFNDRYLRQQHQFQLAWFQSSQKLFHVFISFIYRLLWFDYEHISSRILYLVHQFTNLFIDFVALFKFLNMSCRKFKVRIDEALVILLLVNIFFLLGLGTVYYHIFILHQLIRYTFRKLFTVVKSFCFYPCLEFIL